MLNGEEVTRDGLVKVDRARLWTRPPEPPPLIGAAVSTKTAAWVAGWADGLVTVNAPEEQLRAMISAYRDAGGRGPLCLQVHLSWAATEADAEAIAHDQWRSNIFPPPVCWDLEMVDHFDVVSENVTVEQVRKVVNVSADLEEHIEKLRGYAALGFDRIYLHHVGQDLTPFIETFGAKVLPALR
jgi:alkanesulfonate monooxygenase SsuD/methylene tetrahydromethanopterin reductase-like flavin-dependent oxidoreductase (luciferase family)